MSATSLGLHRPTGLQYMIEEGILPSTHKAGSYQWQSYSSRIDSSCVDEEIISTSHCVAWSQGNSVRASYRFDLEGEPVTQALLTSFCEVNSSHETEDQSDGGQTSSKTSRRSKDKSRALVVLLSTKLHIHFLQGSHHVVDLPFQIDRIFAAPQGIVLQRTASKLPSLPPTPKPLAAPHNSFFSSQQTPNSSYLQSPTLQRRLANGVLSSQTEKDENIESSLDKLWKGILASPSKDDRIEDEALFSLTDPFSELCLITEAHSLSNFKLSRSQPSNNVDFLPLDAGEVIVYVSPVDECPPNSSYKRHGDLMLVVTVNNNTGMLSVWHAWYLKERSLADLVRARTKQKAEHARRRSSFYTTSHGTGTTTPAVRRDGLRESMVAMSQPTRKTTRKASNQIDETTMASQLDPDFPDSTQQSEKDNNRRISSLVSRGDLSMHDTKLSQAGGASFTGQYRRSFGVPNERRSLGYRRSRGSTPGSVLSRSVVLDDDVMDLDSQYEADTDVSDILHHMRAACENVGAESILGPLEDGWKREIVVRKIHAFDCGNASAKDIKTTMVREQPATTKNEHDILHLYLRNQVDDQVFHLTLRIFQQALFPEDEDSTYVALPIVQEEAAFSSSDDLLRLSTEDSDAVIVGGKKLQFGGSDFTSILAGTAYRLHNPLAIFDHDFAESVEFGKNRMVSPPSGPIHLDNGGSSCIYVEIDHKGQSHRRKLYVEPGDSIVRKLLSACELVLPSKIAQSVRLTWFAMHQDLQSNSSQLIGTCQTTEWIALAAMIFSIVSGLLDEKSRAALKLARMAARREDARHHGSLLRQQSRSKLRTRTVWSALALHPSLSNQVIQSRTLDQALPIAIALAIDKGTASKTSSFEEDATLAVQLLLGLHILFEEQKLDIGLNETIKTTLLPPIIAQLGFWLNIEAWTATSSSHYGLEGGSTDGWAYVRSNAYRHAGMEIMERPVGVFEWLENCLATTVPESFPSLDKIAALSSSTSLPPMLVEQARNMTPRINMLDELLMHTTSLGSAAHDILKAMHKCGITTTILETLPAGVATPLREAVTKSELSPANSWPDHLLQLAGREDLMKDSYQQDAMRLPANIDQSAHDIHTVCHAIELAALPTKTREADRNAISQLIFSEDRRLVHAASLLHFNTVQIAECEKQPDWSDAYYFDQQKRIMQFVTVRMIALPAGDALLHYDSQTPLMTEKYHLPGFASSCIMQPNGHTVTTDRSALTEEKVNWAYFHAGVSSGLKISRQAIGIDTSWLVFNKPVELTNRHAGLLLALGLNGHLRNVAKWLSFKYLTPKHAMTSLGLLLGLAASNLGSMDGLVTRMLSVHISCMLPPGATELNVSPLTQTAGLLGIGLLYHNSQHRRMSEIMLHEIENLDTEDADSGPDVLRDESYRLAAGLSLGIINLAHGSGLRGLHGLSVQDRLLRIAVGSRPVGAVHVFDKATAGAIMAIVLIFMKTNDTAVARRIDVPDTNHQFEHVRPDMLMLRTMAKHIILWDAINISNGTGQDNWITRNLPRCCRSKWHELSDLNGSLRSSDLPLYYIVTGLAWAVSLKYAGSGNVNARNEVLNCLNIFSSLIRGRSKETYYYDQKLAQAGLRRCTDVLALSAATIMAGTGDLQTFRFLRRLHGRTDSETPYGSHFAAHMAIGMLFMAGGTLTLGTSNLAIAALVCSLYPLFPTDVHDNRVHLQAFRHLWVFAIEPRCLVLEDIDTRRPLSTPVSITLQDGSTRSMQAPCLIPNISTITTIKTVDAGFWPVTLDFSSDSTQRQAFSRNQVVQIRRCPTADSHFNAFWATFCALNIDPERKNSTSNLSSWILARSVLAALDQNDVELILPPDTRSSTYVDGKTMKADDQLILRQNARSNNSDGLWDMRVLLAWIKVRAGDSSVETRWLRKQDLQALESVIDDRRRRSRT